MSLFRLGRHRSPPPPPVSLPASPAPATRVYAFGDVHGRADLLARLAEGIRADLDRAPPAGRAIVIGLGDFIDRGLQSNRVLQMLIEGVAGCETIAIRGNHEQMLLDFLADPARTGATWLANGGLETMQSYGVDLRGIGRPDRADLRPLREALAGAMPPPQLAFLEALPLTFVSGDYLFVHAGVRPGIALDRQDPGDLLWIREGFCDRDEPFEKVVVHGHTPAERPYIGQYRVNLDTGAYFSNLLNCLVLEGQDQRLLPI